MWYESDTGRQFVYYNDGNTSQWVEVGTASFYSLNIEGGRPDTTDYATPAGPVDGGAP